MTTKGLPLAKGAPRQRRFLMAVPVTIVTLHRKSDIESGAGVNDIEIGLSISENIFGDCMYKEDVLYFELRILRDVRLLYSDRQFAGELSKVMNECRVITELTAG